MFCYYIMIHNDTSDTRKLFVYGACLLGLFLVLPNFTRLFLESDCTNILSITPHLCEHLEILYSLRYNSHCISLWSSNLHTVQVTHLLSATGHCLFSLEKWLAYLLCFNSVTCLFITFYYFLL